MATPSVPSPEPRFESEGSATVATGKAAPGDSPLRKFFRALGGYTPDVVRYLYLMRFSLFLWLSMIALAWADAFTSAASITRGILTPFSPWQYFFTGLAVVLPGWFALLAARIVCAYGQDRFGITPPPWFEIEDKMEWFAFWGAQIPGIVLLGRIAYNVVHEGESRGYYVVIPCLLAGAFAALVFWYVVSILYYWIWDPNSAVPVRAFLVPHWSKIDLDAIQNMPCGSSLRLFSRAMTLLCRLGPGYQARVEGHEDKTKTGPGHIVATIALVCAVVLYVIMMPISAPVQIPLLAWFARGLSALLAIYLVQQFIIPAWRGLRSQNGPACPPLEARDEALVESGSGEETEQGRSTHARLPLVAALIGLGFTVIGILCPHAPRVLPVIAYVIILLVVVFWTMAGIAFFADHYRIPVVTLTALVILGLNHWPAEHVFPAQRLPDSVATQPLIAPADYVNRIAFQDNNQNDDPVIIITATGGGIHAAAWTATVLQALDQAFQQNHIRLQDHILLMSSVSGGSVATAGFLREYFANRPFDANSYDRINAVAGCSSLQAVAWGLAYPDTLRLLFPWVFNAFSSLDRFDRGWALQQALDRNMHDSFCVQDDAARAGGPSLGTLTLNRLATLDPSSQLCRQHANACAHFPAFTLNTTVVETGDRFLLSNYSVFAGKQGTDEVLPAASFLGVYGRENILPESNPQRIPGRGAFADISLATAARLSASFTYVSPAARLPFEDAEGTFQNAYHFVDGGYYDNDGTNSVIEFLKAAGYEKTKRTFTARHPLRVLLIEIRNSDDLNESDSPDSYAFQGGLQWDQGQQRWTNPSTDRKRRFGPVGQLLAPPEAAVNAGFGSTTARNRRELNTLEHAFCSSLEMNHVVLDYQQEIRQDAQGKIIEGESELYQPLSWHLTRREAEWISGANQWRGTDDYALDRKKGDSDRTKIQQAVEWFQQAESRSHTSINPAQSCAQMNAPANQ